ncbi:MAG TPA: hypothetical protein VKG87_04190, partial [Terriglobales bacterium]|nr:hypothetical protein [Terriglobales bacterium]
RRAAGSAYFTNGCPGELRPRRCSFFVTACLSLSDVLIAIRLRRREIFSLRVRRRRISGRREGPDINIHS